MTPPLPPAEPLGRLRTRRSRRVGVAVIAAVGLLVLAVSRTSLFAVRDVEVHGAGRLSRPQVLERAGLGGGENVPWLDEEAIERRLETDPWIARAEVSTRLPWTIRLEVVERSPVAVASDGREEVLVAADGTELGPASARQRLPVIRLPDPRAYEGPAPSVAGAVAAIDAMPPRLRADVSRATLLGVGTLQLRLEGGIAVRYGDLTEPARKATALDRVLAWARSEDVDVASISLAAPGVPAVRLEP